MRGLLMVAAVAVMLLAPAAGVAAPAWSEAPHVRPHLPGLAPRSITFDAALAHAEPRALASVALALAHDRAPASALAALGGSTELALPWRDADGDGRPDLVGVARDMATRRVALSGIRGGDGSTLWSDELGTPDDALVTPTSDVTGDARADVLVTTFTITSDHSSGACILGCIGQRTVAYTWQIMLLSGANGGIAWQQDIRGSWVELDAVIPIVQATNVTVIAMPTASGVVIDAYDADLAPGVELVAARAEVRDGAAGHVLAARANDLSTDFAIMLPSAGADVVWERDVAWYGPIGETHLDVERANGSTGATRWWSNASASGTITQPALADLTGDDIEDVFTIDLTTVVHASGLLDGADGHARWLPVPGDPYVLGPGLALALELTTSGSNTHFVAHRVDGASGVVTLTTRPFLGDQANAFSGLQIWGDLDGDGVTDLVVNHLYNDVGDDSTTLVESGATGARLFLEDAPGIWFYAAAGDLDADGADDAYRITNEYENDPNTGELTGFTLAIEARALDGAGKWWHNESFLDLPGMSLAPAGDAVGSPGDDGLLQFADLAPSGAFASRAVMLDGATGAVAWTRGALP